jgi:transcriptional antiterminator NusG
LGFLRRVAEQLRISLSSFPDSHCGDLGDGFGLQHWSERLLQLFRQLIEGNQNSFIPMSELKWYVVRVVSGQEKKVKDYLEKEIVNEKMQDFIGQVMTPTEKVYQIRKMKDGKTKKVAVERNFFPGYVMVNADLTNGEAMHLIKNIPGVIGFLQVDGRDPSAMPRPMRESEINRIIGKVEDGEEQEVIQDSSFIVGESVKVMDGPFNGFTGLIEEVFEEKKKLNVMVKIFGRNAPLELNYSQVEKVE